MAAETDEASPVKSFNPTCQTTSSGSNSHRYGELIDGQVGMDGNPKDREIGMIGQHKRNSKVVETKAVFGDVFSALNAAHSALQKVESKWQAEENAVQNVKNTHEVELKKTRAALVDLRKGAQNEIKKRDRDFDAIVTILQVQQQKLEGELDAARNALQKEQRDRFDAEFMSFAARRKKTEAELKVHKLCDATDRERKVLESELSTLKVEQRKLEDELDVARNALKKETKDKFDAEFMLFAATRKKTETELKMHKLCDAADRDRKLLVSELSNLKHDFISAAEENKRLQSTQETLEKKLNEEKAKSFCWICKHSPKDTIALPCLHFRFCSQCLDERTKRRKSCPICSVPISGVIKCGFE